MNLNVKAKTIRHLEENKGENICDLSLGKIVLDRTHKLETKKNYKSDSIKI